MEIDSGRWLRQESLKERRCREREVRQEEEGEDPSVQSETPVLRSRLNRPDRTDSAESERFHPSALLVEVCPTLELE